MTMGIFLHSDAPEECMHRKSMIVLGAAIIASGVLLNAQAPGQSPGQPPGRPSVPTPSPTTQGQVNQGTGDQAFVVQTAKNGMAEVELGKLASEKASNAKVKAFGQRMVTDHGRAGDELKSLATAKQITLPTMPDPEHKAMHDRLAKLSGAEFDRAYAREMVSGHRKGVDSFTMESMNGKDNDVKAWATKTLPTVREHLRMIEEIDTEVASSTK
jgi:putative membrane protein